MTQFIQDTFSLAGKTALVTGGAKGIGRMISEAYLKAGAKVIISSRSEQDCAEAAREMSQLGPCKAFPKDLSNVDSITQLANEIADLGWGLTTLVNNSGRTWGAPLEEYSEKGWDSVMTLNVKSPFYLVQKLLPLLEASADADQPATVINIGSIAGIAPAGLSAYAYNASKAAIHHLTHTLAGDLVGRHINVNAMAPGFFASNMVAPLQKDPHMDKKFLQGIPMGRLGRAQDIGGVAVFLAGAGAAFITGAVIPVDGGYLSRG